MSRNKADAPLRIARVAAYKFRREKLLYPASTFYTAIKCQYSRDNEKTLFH
uniref:Uncharacterized protein n=1 Tax=Arundo donax TaxID=35708 RepID=A0A0A9CAM7_ARUDO